MCRAGRAEQSWAELSRAGLPKAEYSAVVHVVAAHMGFCRNFLATGLRTRHVSPKHVGGVARSDGTLFLSNAAFKLLMFLYIFFSFQLQACEGVPCPPNMLVASLVVT